MQYASKEMSAREVHAGKSEGHATVCVQRLTSTGAR